jgi:hypothetical protein
MTPNHKNERENQTPLKLKTVLQMRSLRKLKDDAHNIIFSNDIIKELVLPDYMKKYNSTIKDNSNFKMSFN